MDPAMMQAAAADPNAQAALAMDPAMVQQMMMQGMAGQSVDAKPSAKNRQEALERKVDTMLTIMRAMCVQLGVSIPGAEIIDEVASPKPGAEAQPQTKAASDLPWEQGTVADFPSNGPAEAEMNPLDLLEEIVSAG